MKILPIFLFTAVSASAAVNIIDSTYGVGAGSFELGSYSQNSGNVANYMRLATSSTAITGWIVGGPDGVDWMTSPSNVASNGDFSVDLAGASFVHRPSDGSISTIIPTVIGMEYLISFSAYGGVDLEHLGRLTAGSLTQIFTAPGNPNPEVAAYTDFQYSFTAQSNLTTITFSTQPDSYGFGPVIDNVVVTIPELSSALLCGISGFGMLMTRRRFRNRRG